MISEKEYVIQAFKEHFVFCKNKNIVIYGLGKNTQVLLEEFPEFNFIGLMDSVMTGKMVFDKKVLCYDEVVSMKTDVIIIVARHSNVRIIYKRIYEFCRENNILVYDINGNCLKAETELELIDNKYFHISEEQLKKKILEHNVISFDVFDTLITRKVLYPKDIFEIVQIKSEFEYNIKCDYSSNRIKAELELNAITSPTIFDIYERFREITNISKEECNILLDLEIKIEQENLIPRDKMVEIFKWTLEQGKKVYLISDMYLTSKFLEPILVSLGITGYMKLLVSSEYKKSKCNGLFEEYKKTINSNSVLHIGDNYEADIVMAKKNSINAFSIKSGLDMLAISQCEILVNLCKTLYDRQAAGLFIARAFNNPFLFSYTKGKIQVNSNKDLGYLITAPVITKFMYWFSNQVINNKYDIVLLSARDGFLIEKLYKIISKDKQLANELLPKSIYFETSRMSSILAGIETKDDIIYAANLAFSGTPEEMLSKRFFLKDNEITPYNGKECIEKYILNHKDLILRNASIEREHFNVYIDKINIRESKNIAFFDFVSSGTCQLNLENVLGRNLKGMYFVRINENYLPKQQLSIQSLYDQRCIYSEQNYIFNSYIFLENIMTSYDPSLKRFDENGDGIYLTEKRSGDQIEAVQQIHEGIIEYFNDYFNNLKNVRNQEFNERIPDLILSFIRTKYSCIDEKLLKNKVLSDEFCNREFSWEDSISM